MMCGTLVQQCDNNDVPFLSGRIETANMLMVKQLIRRSRVESAFRTGRVMHWAGQRHGTSHAALGTIFIEMRRRLQVLQVGVR